MPKTLMERILPGGPWSVAAIAVLAGGFLAAWLFGWTEPSRRDLEGLLHVSFALNTSLDAWTSDARRVTLTQNSVAGIGAIRCQSRSRRRMPTIRYVCIYDLTDVDGAKYRLVLGAEHNLGWRRLGMADFGNYRLVDAPVEQQQAALADDAT
jgi:hypothetical protein